MSPCLAALRVYFAFCKAGGYRTDDLPTAGVKRVAEQPAGPRWFLKREVRLVATSNTSKATPAWSKGDGLLSLPTSALDAVGCRGR